MTKTKKPFNKDEVKQELLSSLSSENAGIINRFLMNKECSDDIKDGTYRNYLRALNFLFKKFRGDLTKTLTIEDKAFLTKRVKDSGYAEATKLSIKITMMMFLKYVDEHELDTRENKMNRPLFNDLDLTKVKADIEFDDLITEDDFNKMLSGCRGARDRALLSVFFDTGCRPVEVRNMKLKDLVVNNLGIDIKVKVSKTKHGTGRTVFVVKHREFLIDYLKIHPG